MAQPSEPDQNGAGHNLAESELTENELLSRRLSILQVVARELVGAPSTEKIAHVAMHLVDTPVSTVSRGLWLVTPRGREMVLVAEHDLPPTAAERFRVIPIDSELPGAVAHRTRQTVVSGSRVESEKEFTGLQGADRSAESFVAVPLLLGTRCLGVLGLGYERPPEQDDLGFLEAVAGQVAQALERAQLTERDEQRREALEFLANLTDAALNATDHEDLIQRVTSAAVPTLGDWCSLTFLPTNGDPPFLEVAHSEPEKVAWAKSLQERYPYDPESTSGVAQAIRTGETEHIADVTQQLIDELTESSSMGPEQARAIIEEMHLTSVITVPLRTRRRIIGAMQFVHAESDRRYDSDDVGLAEAVAGRIAEPLENAWRADQQLRMSEVLQRSLLPPKIPVIPGIDVAAEYWPAGVTEVGGDFYDIFALSGDSWAIVIGDVCGTGPDSAALTSIVRHTVRAGARHGHSSTEVIDWVNEAVLKSDRNLFCTLCFATLEREPGGFVLRTTAAGHPLPVLLSSRGAETLGLPGTLAGVLDTVEVSTNTVHLDPGDSVILYTDGITDVPPPYGVTAEEFRVAVAPLRSMETAEDIASALRSLVTERVPEELRTDDVAYVVLRVQ